MPDECSMESLTKSLIEVFQSESSAFYYIFDDLSHIEEPDSIVEGCIEVAWERHVALEDLIAKYKSLLEENDT
jgi:hypothetical protein